MKVKNLYLGTICQIEQIEQTNAKSFCAYTKEINQDIFWKINGQLAFALQEKKIYPISIQTNETINFQFVKKLDHEMVEKALSDVGYSKDVICKRKLFKILKRMDIIES